MILDTSRFPAKDNLSQWTRVLGIAYATALKYYKNGRLKGTRNIHGEVIVTKEEVLRCFKITPKEAATR